MIRFVPKDRIEETHGERMVAAANLRTMRRKEPERKEAMAEIRRKAPKKENASTELDRIGVSILEGLEYLLERNKGNKAKKAAWEEEEGKKAWAASSEETEREKNATNKGGKGGGVEALQKGTRASYRASARQARQGPTEVSAFTKAQAERRASHKPMLQRVAGATAALKDAKKDRPKLP